MSATEIKKLIGKFNDAVHNMEHAFHMSQKKGLTKEEKEEWEVDADFSEMELHYLANEIQKLNPSKYMMKKHIELEDILSYI